MAERYDVIFDFTSYAGQAIELRNLEDVGDIGTDDDYDNTGKVMRFNVAATTTSPDTSTVPTTLRAVPFPPASTGVDHHFRFHRTNGEWRINGVGFADVNNRMLANVPRGTVEIWELENSSGGWTHPIHVHLVDFRVIRRTGGNRGVMSYEAQGLKDVVWLAKGETVTVEAHYAPWDGVYMFHCHNLIHEDHDMMAAFNVTALPNFGYNNALFIDPMEPLFRAKPYVLSDLRNRTGPFSEQSIETAVLGLVALNPYGDVAVIEQALDDYWAGQKKRDVKPSVENEDTAPVPRYRRFQI
jgi:bilirubin oxidase